MWCCRRCCAAFVCRCYCFNYCHCCSCCTCCCCRWFPPNYYYRCCCYSCRFFVAVVCWYYCCSYCFFILLNYCSIIIILTVNIFVIIMTIKTFISMFITITIHSTMKKQETQHQWRFWPDTLVAGLANCSYVVRCQNTPPRFDSSRGCEGVWEICVDAARQSWQGDVTCPEHSSSVGGLHNWTAEDRQTTKLFKTGIRFVTDFMGIQVVLSYFQISLF